MTCAIEPCLNRPCLQSLATARKEWQAVGDYFVQLLQPSMLSTDCAQRISDVLVAHSISAPLEDVAGLGYVCIHPACERSYICHYASCGEGSSDI